MSSEISMSRSRGRVTILHFCPSISPMMYYRDGVPTPLEVGQRGYFLYSLGVGFESITGAALWGDAYGYPCSGKWIREGAAGKMANGDAIYVDGIVTVIQIDVLENGHVAVRLKA